ncbi:MAG: hypothetical protein BEN19_02310 [Epulopiscium sp. Nuni2H_MBin003]|nr:MAG: hypothetical protein BEN19_02310 [Epulopiscium sp. Nuni2H_MBin003]
MEQIKCIDTQVGYDKKALIGPLNFTIHSGNYWCITGSNGIGKSTLIKTLLNLIPPVSGEIIKSIPQTDIGYLPQQKMYQRNFPASVKEIVLSGTLNKGRWFYSAADKELATANITKLGMQEYINKPYNSLSGGQQQRVLLARAICSSNKLLILDEPVAGLDPNVTKDMYALIKQLNQQDNITIIMISHDVEYATKYASHILHIEKKEEYTVTVN